MRMTMTARGALSLFLLVAGLIFLTQPSLATSITYLYETGAVGEIEPCG
jgi:hypothetical protein